MIGKVKDISGNDDRALYAEFKAHQLRQQADYAGAGSKNDASRMHYGVDREKFAKFAKHNDGRSSYKPEWNTRNIMERQLARHKMPATRDRFIKNGFAQMVLPGLADEKVQRGEVKVPFAQRKDPLDIDDIDGTRENKGGWKRIKGRDYMDLGDMEKARPAQLKANRVTNIPDYKLSVEGIDDQRVRKLVVKKPRNPLDPSYTVETRSRRVVHIGAVEGSKPLHHKSPVKDRGAAERWLDGGKVQWPSPGGDSPGAVTKPKQRNLLRNSSQVLPPNSRDYSLRPMRPEVDAPDTRDRAHWASIGDAGRSERRSRQHVGSKQRTQAG